MVLESRHLVGLFLLMVVISGVVFTLGYVLGRSQYYSQVRVAAASPEPARPEPTAQPVKPSNSASPAGRSPQDSAASAQPPADWDFFKAAEPKKTEEFKPQPKSSAPAKAAPPAKASTPAAAVKKSLLTAPLVAHGAIVLQVAALTREDDALALAEALQQKKFPAFVLTPGADHYYRVQVGPYTDAQSAAIARRGLEHEGFKSILKR